LEDGECGAVTVEEAEEEEGGEEAEERGW